MNMKKAIKIAVSVLSWIVLILALLVTILVFTADSNNGVSNLLGYMPLTVESDSMAPTFSSGDLIIDCGIDDVYKLQKDDVITFWTIIDGNKVKNTHRIIGVNSRNGSVSFVTKGDNNDVKDSIEVYPSDIIGKWTGVKIGGFGSVMSFLRTKTGFFVCIIIPIALFFLFELYKFIVTIVEIKRPAAVQLDEEEIKKKAIEEYLAQQKELSDSAGKDSAADTETTDSEKDNSEAEANTTDSGSNQPENNDNKDE